jgi:hypothetical protein
VFFVNKDFPIVCVCVCGVAFEIETRPGEFSRTVVRSTPPRNKKKKIKKRMKSTNKREITDLGRFGMNKIFPKLSLSRSTIVGRECLVGPMICVSPTSSLVETVYNQCSISSQSGLHNLGKPSLSDHISSYRVLNL